MEVHLHDSTWSFGAFYWIEVSIGAVAGACSVAFHRNSKAAFHLGLGATSTVLGFLAYRQASLTATSKRYSHVPDFLLSASQLATAQVSTAALTLALGVYLLADLTPRSRNIGLALYGTMYCILLPSILATAYQLWWLLT